MRSRRAQDLLRFGLFLAILAAIVAYLAAWRHGGPQGARPEPEGLAGEPAALPPAPAPPGQPGGSAAGTAGEQDDFFAGFRLERDRARGREREMLRELMTAGTPDEARRQANERYLRLSRLMGLEAELEGLIRGRGFRDAVVLLGENTAQVVIRAPSLSPVEASAVADLVSQVAGVAPDRIRIVARER